MVQKRLLEAARQRHLPAHFSWLDQCLVRDGFVDRCGADALALYLFLVTVGDAEGLSYYGDAAVVRRLRLDARRLVAARKQLIAADLVAWQPPLYQVLSPPERALPSHRPYAVRCQVHAGDTTSACTAGRTDVWSACAAWQRHHGIDRSQMR